MGRLEGKPNGELLGPALKHAGGEREAGSGRQELPPAGRRTVAVGRLGRVRPVPPPPRPAAPLPSLLLLPPPLRAALQTAGAAPPGTRGGRPCRDVAPERGPPPPAGMSGGCGGHRAAPPPPTPLGAGRSGSQSSLEGCDGGGMVSGRRVGTALGESREKKGENEKYR